MAVGLFAYSAREREIDQARKYYWGRQYDEKAEWTDEAVPTTDRRPTVRIRLAKQAVDTLNSYLFGEKRTPMFSVENNEELTAEVQGLHRRSGLKRKHSEIGRLGLLQGSIALAFHAMEGEFDIEFLEVGLAQVTLGRQDKARAQELGVPFDDVLEYDEYWRELVTDAFGNRREELLHRRQWTTDAVVEYVPLETNGLEATEDMRTLADLPWVEDAERTSRHEYGFCPVEWIPNGEIAGDVEGHPLLSDAEFDLEDQINYTLSQCGRGIQYNGEPLVAFLNVQGARANNKNDTTSPELQRGSGNTISLRSGASGHPADIKAVELSGSGQTVAMEFSNVLVRSMFEVLQIVRHDPQLFAGTLSGVALERVLGPTIAHVGKLRPYYGRGLSRILQKMLRASGAADDVEVTVGWPDVVERTSDDLAVDVAAIGDALDRGLITLETAVEQLANAFNIDDVEAYVKALADEARAAGTGFDGFGGQSDPNADPNADPTDPANR